MDIDELFTPRKPKGITLGEDLSRLSVEQLDERLQAISEEKARIEAEMAAKRSARAAADAVFKR
jgi:uncharacterized small protein (DUF1192 family)